MNTLRNDRRNVDRPEKRWRDKRGVALYLVAVDDDNSFGHPNQRIQPSATLVQNSYCASCIHLQTDGT